MKGLLLSICAVATLSAQFSSAVELVPLNVSVLDARRQFIDGLQAEDFSVYDNGRAQDVVFFGSSALAVDVALLLDVSGSMGAPLPLIREAALGFVDRLRPGDRAAVVGFARHVRLHEGLTSDRAALSTALDGLDTRGSTALFDALYVMAQQLERDRAQSRVIRRQAIVILSDGYDTASHVSFEDAAARARRSGATIYTIAPQPFEGGTPDKDGGKARRESEFYLRTLARDTGGRSFIVGDASTLPDIYATVAAELHHQYTIAFRPQIGEAASRLRQLDVRLASHPGVTIRTRRSYELP